MSDQNPPVRVPKSPEAAEELALEDTGEELTDNEERKRRNLAVAGAREIGNID
jgi:hypothetical protein